MVSRILAMALIGCSVLLCPSRAVAQNDNLAGLVTRLFDQATVNQLSSGIDHTPHFFLGGENLTLATREFNVALAAQLASFPLSSSSGGFSFSVNDTGEVVPRATTFGPAFAERALTIGKGKFNVGFSFQAVSYDSFDGVDIESGGLSFVRQHNNCCPPTANDPDHVTDGAPLFELDLLRSNLRLKVDTRTTAFFGNFGVMDRLDVGFAVPITHVDLEGTVDGSIVKVGSAATPATHVFPNGTDRQSFQSSDSATGLGDILLRAKYGFYQAGTTALAGAIDLRLPTGDKDNLLGTGATQTQLMFIASGEYGVFSPHGNLGYTASNGDTSEATTSIFPTVAAAATAADPGFTPAQVDLSVPDEINYVAGVNVALGPRVTVGFDARGRVIRDVARFEIRDNTYNGTLATNEFSLKDRNGNVNLLLGVIGGKFNVTRTLLLNLTVLFPMTDGGLKIKPAPVVGFDYVF